MTNEEDMNTQQSNPLSLDIRMLDAGQWLKLNNQVAPQLGLSTSESHPFVCIGREGEQVTLVILTTAPGLHVDDYVKVGDVLDLGKASYVNKNTVTVSLAAVQQHKQSKPKKLPAERFSLIQQALK